ncbi:MAG: hypothetical protein U0Q18_08780 [Bryobacteraceae bacterium]
MKLSYEAFILRIGGLALAILSLGNAQTPALKQPPFQALMTSTDPNSNLSSTYFSFLNNVPVRTRGSVLQSIYPFPASGTGAVDYGCPWPTGSPAAPPFWFDGPGSTANLLPTPSDPAPARPASSGNISNQQAGTIMGIIFKGSFAGNVINTSSQNQVYETVYFGQQRCYFAHFEYGFFRDIVGQQTYFYWARNANCGFDLYCRTGTQASDPYVNQSGGAVPLTDSGAAPLTYMAWINTGTQGNPPATVYMFHVRIVDANGTVLYDKNLAQGSLAASLVAATGFVTAGIQRVDLNGPTTQDPNNPIQLNANLVGSFYCSTGPAGYCTTP